MELEDLNTENYIFVFGLLQNEQNEKNILVKVHRRDLVDLFVIVPNFLF